ncbi:hypothetical protein C8R43DRAFT_819373, partial [Mycena crocata]
SVKVAALNIKGNGNVNIYHPDNKWWHIWQVMWTQKVGVLITGESHLDAERKANIDHLFGKKLRIEFSRDPATPNAKGVAFAISKDKVKMEGIKTREIIPGRAMILELKKHDDKPLSILGIYAPNVPAENEAFWKKIGQWYTDHPNVRKPDLMGRDTNIVESAEDRLPARSDTNGAVSALDDLKTQLGLVDGWRDTNPTQKAYTY